MEKNGFLGHDEEAEKTLVLCLVKVETGRGGS